MSSRTDVQQGRGGPGPQRERTATHLHPVQKAGAAPQVTATAPPPADVAQEPEDQAGAGFAAHPEQAAIQPVRPPTAQPVARRSRPAPPVPVAALPADSGQPTAATAVMAVESVATAGWLAAIKQQAAQARPYAIAAGIAVSVLVIYLAINTTISFLGQKADDLTYGKIRKVDLQAYVGHNETPDHPTYFIAANLDQKVGVIEVPGGDWSKARAIAGPYLFGKDASKIPVHLSVSDVGCNGKPALLEEINGEQIVYINSGTDFHLMTAAERSALPTSCPATPAVPGDK